MDASVRCPRCWKHVPLGARFCPRCGSALIPATRTVAVPASLAPRTAGGGGLTALLMFLVLGAFGLMVMLLVSSHASVQMPATPSPVLVEPNGSAPTAPEVVGTGDDRVATPQYAPGPDYYHALRVYEARPRAIPYPPAPYPGPWSHDRSRDPHR